MELAGVRAFLILAEQLHFGRAAALLHLSQPALTKAIHRLEEEVGGRLFTRGRQGARLTDVGQQLLTGARALAADADRLLALARRAARGETGRLRIGFGFHTLELVPRQPVASLVLDQTYGLVVAAVPRVFAPGVFGPDRPHR